MRRAIRIFLCFVPLIALIGCGASVDEKPPPKTAPEMSAEEKKKQQDEIKRMEKMYKQGQNK